MILPPNSIIASGPVIIENNKVLLDRENKNGRITPWFFPGGIVDSFGEPLTEACKREAKEELNLDIEILKPLETLLHYDQNENRLVILCHYLCRRLGDDNTIQKGDIVCDWAWHDINNLPSDCAPNVYEIIKDLKL